MRNNQVGHGALFVVMLLGIFIGACPSKRALDIDASVDATATSASASASPSMSASSAASSIASSSDTPAPAKSIELANPPDVRVKIPEMTKATVKAGQTFGILVPPAHFLLEWDLEPKPPCTLGEPLTFITREDGRELFWKIEDDKVGPHVVTVRLMERATRESKWVVKKRVQVKVDVVR